MVCYISDIAGCASGISRQPFYRISKRMKKFLLGTRFASFCEFVSSEKASVPHNPTPKAQNNQADNAAELSDQKESRERSLELLGKIERLTWRVYLRGKSKGKLK